MPDLRAAEPGDDDDEVGRYTVAAVSMIQRFLEGPIWPHGGPAAMVHAVADWLDEVTDIADAMRTEDEAPENRDAQLLLREIAKRMIVVDSRAKPTARVN